MQNIISFWEKLSETEKAQMESAVLPRHFQKGEVIVRTDEGCLGALLVKKGQIRTYILSEEGRDVTLYRLRQGDICVLSASCLMDTIAFDVSMEAMEETEVLVIPAQVLHPIMEQNPYVELYFSKLANERFSDVMWTMQQILFFGVDKRVASFLWDEMLHAGDGTIRYTHEEIARYIGSAREVVTRIMKNFAEENIVELGRGKIKILDKEKLKACM